uniref:Protein ECT2 n=1 Tax=Plectus sambesii TaxID=2011161 RepID=A0A914WN09_9BILA
MGALSYAGAYTMWSFAATGPPKVTENVNDGGQCRRRTGKFKVELLESVDGREYLDQSEVVYLCDDFMSSEFNNLNAREKRILGPTVVFECASACKELPLPRKNRPLYCWSMKGVTVWNTGLTKNETKHILALVHFMGGSVRKDITEFATHMIARTVKGEKYRCAVSAGKQVMHPDWVEECWQKRNVPNSSALSKIFVSKHLLRPFCGLRIALHGFIESETGHMGEQIAPLGGTDVPISDPQVTHLVIDHMNMEGKSMPDKPNSTCHVVTAEWFWVSIQLGVCANEALYCLEGGGGGGNNARRQSRKRSALSPAPSEPLRSSRKTNLRKSSSQDGWLSLEALESSNVSETLPDHIFSTDDIEALLLDSPRKSSSMSKRQQVCMELLQTERNYVEVLRIILKTFKEPLESMHDEELLTKSELTLIFGKIPPLLAVHENICHELVNLVSHWSEERPIGAVWLKAARELQRVYPSFINSFDAAKELLKECDRTKPKFHAFLKACQTRSECQRQTLVELLIRPVQRLGSVQLLLKDILKRTDKSNGDFEQLQQAIQSIEGVLK